MKKLSALLVSVAIALSFPTSADARGVGVRKNIVKDYEYGNVYIYAINKGDRTEPLVLFRHWVHRQKYTCRICHAELGFSMKMGASDIRKEDLEEGYYCSACHNGEIAFSTNGCNPEHRGESCLRCHYSWDKRELRRAFKKATKGFPRANFGNRIDWEQAELSGLFETIDFIENISLKRKTIKPPMDFEKKAEEIEMPEIIFSHNKHTTWSGCEACHPDLFEPKLNTSGVTMQMNFDGSYCGECHGKVAFPTYDCQRCHSADVQ